MLAGLSHCDGFVETFPALVDACVIFKHCQRLGSVSVHGAELALNPQVFQVRSRARSQNRSLTT